MDFLFLDIDGVLTHYEYQKKLNASGKKCTCEPQIDPDAVKRLQKLVQYFPELKIVISSVWRLYPKGMERLKQLFEEVNILNNVVGRTPHLLLKDNKYHTCRGDEIQNFLDSYLKAHQPKPLEKVHIAILDDKDDMKHLKPYLVRTSLLGARIHGGKIKRSYYSII
jgi:hypothetical protein